jgi:uncharacterized protein YndB with AHSA1/START domain
MAELTVTTFIDRPPQEVFDYMSDVTNFPEWQADTVTAEWLAEGPIGVGSKASSVARLMGFKMRADFEVSNWDPPESWGMKGGVGPMTFANLNRFESQDGGTRLVQEFQGGLSGFFKFAEGMALRQLTKQVAKDGQALKALLEAAS